MSKLWVAIVLVLLIGVAGGGWYVYTQTQPSESNAEMGDPSASNSGPTPTKAEVDLTEYTDESGFSFQYPSNFRVQQATNLATADYAKLSLVGQTDQFNLHIADTKYKAVADWLKSDPNAPEDTKLAGAVTLGGVSADQYTSADRLYTVAVDQGVLYVLDGPADSASEETYSIIVDTFKFAGQATTSAPASGGGTGGDIIYEAEEVIE